jgi:hypothetical protein
MQLETSCLRTELGRYQPDIIVEKLPGKAKRRNNPLI